MMMINFYYIHNTVNANLKWVLSLNLSFFMIYSMEYVQQQLQCKSPFTVIPLHCIALDCTSANLNVYRRYLIFHWFLSALPDIVNVNCECEFSCQLRSTQLNQHNTIDKQTHRQLHLLLLFINWTILLVTNSKWKWSSQVCVSHFMFTENQFTHIIKIVYWTLNLTDSSNSSTFTYVIINHINQRVYL